MNIIFSTKFTLARVEFTRYTLHTRGRGNDDGVINRTQLTHTHTQTHTRTRAPLFVWAAPDTKAIIVVYVYNTNKLKSIHAR